MEYFISRDRYGHPVVKAGDTYYGFMEELLSLETIKQDRDQIIELIEGSTMLIPFGEEDINKLGLDEITDWEVL